MISSGVSTRASCAVYHALERTVLVLVGSGHGVRALSPRIRRYSHTHHLPNPTPPNRPPPPPQVALGFINIGFWILSQVPQLWENHKRKNVAGLSGAFLFGWLVADSAALLGCSLTEQEPWLIATAGYYVLSDLVSLIAPNFVPMCHEPFFRIRHLLLSLLGARWAVPLLLTPRPPTGRQVAASPR